MRKTKTYMLVITIAALILYIPTIYAQQEFDTHIYTKGSADDFKLSSECKGCHPLIYEEWSKSMHSQATYSKDSLHNTLKEVYEHALLEKGETPGYFCAHCHAPMVKDMEFVILGDKLLEKNDPLETEAVGCTFCHSIESAHDGMPTRYYKLAVDGSVQSPGYSTMDTPAHEKKANPIFKTEEVCSGCHGYLKNQLGVNICSLKEEEWDGVTQCQVCHFREIDGKPSAMSTREKHHSHAAPGGHDEEWLQDCVTLSARYPLYIRKKKTIDFEVSIYNHSAHKLPSTMPFRMVVLKVTAMDIDGNVLWENFKTDPMKEDPKAVFMKVFGAGDKVGVPTWEAEKIVMDTRIPAKNKIDLKYNIPAKKVSLVTADLLYYVIPGPMIDLFQIQKDGYVEESHLIKNVSVMFLD